MKKSLKITALVATGMVVIGLALGFIGIRLSTAYYGGVRFYKNDIQSFPIHGNSVDTYEANPFSSVQVEGNFIELEMLPSPTDKWRVVTTTKGIISAPLVSESDGVLLIEAEEEFSLFNGVNQRRLVQVYFPKDTAFDTISIQLDAAEIELNDFSADEINIEVKAGDIQLENISSAKADLSVKAGEVTLEHCTLNNSTAFLAAGSFEAENFYGENFTADLKMGNLEIQGDLTGTTVIEAKMGDVELSLLQPKSEYTLDLRSRLGETTIDGRSSRSYEAGNGPNNLTLDVSTGTIELEFSDR